MTLKSIKIGELEIELKPITILIGYNGVGKSRFTQLLPLFTNFFCENGYEGGGLKYGMEIEKLLGNDKCSITYSGEEICIGLDKVYTREELYKLKNILYSMELFDNSLDGNLGSEPYLKGDTEQFVRTQLEYLLDLVNIDNKGYGEHKLTKYKHLLEYTKSNTIRRVIELVNMCTETKYGKTIITEHPELYLHPSKQLELGSFFSDLWTQRGIRSIIETHSNLLILRLRKLISTGKLNPSDIILNYFHVKEDNENIEIRQLGFESNGSFKWDRDKHNGLPMSFFGSDVIEALEIY
jgi:predicted ATPase